MPQGREAESIKIRRESVKKVLKSREARASRAPCLASRQTHLGPEAPSRIHCATKQPPFALTNRQKGRTMIAMV